MKIGSAKIKRRQCVSVIQPNITVTIAVIHIQFYKTILAVAVVVHISTVNLQKRLRRILIFVGATATKYQHGHCSN